MAETFPAYVNDDTAVCLGRSATGPDALKRVCQHMLDDGFAPDTGLAIREVRGGPIVRVVTSIGAEASTSER
jgi:hypothetical protein